MCMLIMELFASVNRGSFCECGCYLSWSLHSLHAVHIENTTGSQQPLPSAGNTSSDLSQEETQCSSGFYLGNLSDLGGMACMPVCGEWQQYSDTTTVVADTIVILSSSVFLAASAIAVALSCIQYKRM